MGVLTVDNLSVVFATQGGPVKAVDGVSFDVAEGRTVALVGESGSGKTTVAHAALGLLPKNATATGRIHFRDPVIPEAVRPTVDLLEARAGRGKALKALLGDRITVIFQEPMTALSPLHTIEDQIGDTLAGHRGMSRKEARPLIAAMLERVGFREPQEALKRYPFELSGGMRQRAMIAMALVSRPALLVADEPTTALDVTLQAQIMTRLMELREELGMAVLMITHDLGLVSAMADDLVVLYRGRVMERGPRAALLADPHHPYLKGLMKAVPRIGMKPSERLVPLRTVEPDAALLREGREEDPKAAGPILKAENILKRFAARRGGPPAEPAVNSISFSVARGESVGIVGESGCGKTTTLKMAMRALTPDAGRILYADGDRLVDVHALEGWDLSQFRRRVQLVFQDPFASLNPRMRVGEILAEPLVIHKEGTRESRRERAERLLEAVGLKRWHASRYPHSFSGGQRQRIGIARALALGPELLLLDEPVSALDVSVQAQVLNLLKDLRESLGLSYLFISHNMAVVSYMAERILVMYRGRIVEQGTRDQVFETPRHPYTRALLAAVPTLEPGRALHLEEAARSGASDPAQWPEPYRLLDAQDHGKLVDMGAGHFVAISQHASQGEAA